METKRTFTALTARDRLDVRLWLGWSVIAGHKFASGRDAMKELVRHSVRCAKTEWLAMPRSFRHLLMLETATQMDARLRGLA